MTDRATGGLLFTDLAGFTAFTAERGDAAALRLVERFETLARTLLPDGARVIKQLGDGLFIHFADPATAIPTALALSGTCGDSSMEDGPLWVRTGAAVTT
jgi:class 3 adenylate cyclase